MYDSDLVGLGWAGSSVVLTGSQAIPLLLLLLLLLVLGPHSEQQASRSLQAMHSKDFRFSLREKEGHQMVLCRDVTCSLRCDKRGNCLECLNIIHTHGARGMETLRCLMWRSLPKFSLPQLLPFECVLLCGAVFLYSVGEQEKDLSLDTPSLAHSLPRSILEQTSSRSCTHPNPDYWSCSYLAVSFPDPQLP